MKKHNLLWIIVFVLVSQVCTIYSEEEDELKVTPPEIAEQIGKSAEFTCKHSNEDHNETIIWLNQNGTRITSLNLQRIKDSDGVLAINDIKAGDDGEYTCTTVDRKFNATGTLKIYEMPTYFVEGMVLMGINILLVLVFIACALYQFVKSRRLKKERRNKKLKSVFMDKEIMP